MKKLSDTYKELGIAFSYPIEIKDNNGNLTYYENSDGYIALYKRDTNGNPTSYENSYGDWERCEYNASGIQTYYEDSDGDKEGTPRSQS